MLVFALIACGAPVDLATAGSGEPAWSDPALAGCTVTQDVAWDGSSTNRWRHTYDAAGMRISSAEDDGADGVDELSWAHTWAGETVDTIGASLDPHTTFSDVQRHTFDAGRLVRWEIDSSWHQSDMVLISTGVFVTTWDGGSPAREDWYDDASAVSPYDGADWVWTADGLEARVTRDSGPTHTRAYDADRRLVSKVEDPVADGSSFEVRYAWTYGPLGPTELTYDNDEDGAFETRTTWSYDCP